MQNEPLSTKGKSIQKHVEVPLDNNVTSQIINDEIIKIKSTNQTLMKSSYDSAQLKELCAITAKELDLKSPKASEDSLKSNGISHKSSKNKHWLVIKSQFCVSFLFKNSAAKSTDAKQQDDKEQMKDTEPVQEDRVVRKARKIRNIHLPDNEWFIMKYTREIGAPTTNAYTKFSEVEKDLIENKKIMDKYTLRPLFYQKYSEKPRPSNVPDVRWNGPLMQICRCPIHDCECRGDLLLPPNSIPTALRYSWHPKYILRKITCFKKMEPPAVDITFAQRLKRTVNIESRVYRTLEETGVLKKRGAEFCLSRCFHYHIPMGRENNQYYMLKTRLLEASRIKELEEEKLEDLPAPIMEDTNEQSEVSDGTDKVSDEERTLPLEEREKERELPLGEREKDRALPLGERKEESALSLGERKKERVPPLGERKKDRALPLGEREKEKDEHEIIEGLYRSVTTQSTTDADGEFIYGEIDGVLFGNSDGLVLRDIDGIPLRICSFNKHFDEEPKFNKLLSMRDIKKKLLNVKKNMLASASEGEDTGIPVSTCATQDPPLNDYFESIIEIPRHDSLILEEKCPCCNFYNKRKYGGILEENNMTEKETDTLKQFTLNTPTDNNDFKTSEKHPHTDNKSLLNVNNKKENLKTCCRQNISDFFIRNLLDNIINSENFSARDSKEKNTIENNSVDAHDTISNTKINNLETQAPENIKNNSKFESYNIIIKNIDEKDKKQEKWLLNVRPKIKSSEVFKKSLNIKHELQNLKSDKLLDFIRQQKDSLKRIISNKASFLSRQASNANVFKIPIKQSYNKTRSVISSIIKRIQKESKSDVQKTNSLKSIADDVKIDLLKPKNNIKKQVKVLDSDISEKEMFSMQYTSNLSTDFEVNE